MTPKVMALGGGPLGGGQGSALMNVIHTLIYKT